MQGAVAGRKRGRHPPLCVFVVDDHCDALSKIHGAIRCGALPFIGVSALHFDAHPDLMVTPDMPAETCFSPQELYHALAAAEGGIAEWILPLVYQVSHTLVGESSCTSSCIREKPTATVHYGPQP